MTPDTFTSPLITDDDIAARVRRLVPAADGRRFWLMFLDADQLQRPTVVPVDGIPELPAPDDGVRLAPMLEWLSDAEGATSVVVIHERPGDDAVTRADVEWARCLREAAARSGVAVRASILVSSAGSRWIAPDHWL